MAWPVPDRRAGELIGLVGFTLVAAFPRFPDSAADLFSGLASALLDAANEFLFLAFQELEVIMDEPSELLFQLT